jgi:hypothetical protein
MIETVELIEEPTVKAGKTRRVRMMEPRDLPAAWKLCAAQNRRDKTSYPFPPVFDLNESSSTFGQQLPNVLLALVTEVNGRVRQAHVWLRTVEEMSFGGGKEEMEFSGAHIPMALDLLRRKGLDDVHILVPHIRVSGLSKMLESNQFIRIDHRLAHFFRML